MKVILEKTIVDTKYIDDIGEITYNDINGSVIVKHDIFSDRPQYKFEIYMLKGKNIIISKDFSDYYKKYVKEIKHYDEHEFNIIKNSIRHDLEICRQNLKEYWLENPCSYPKIKF